MVSACRKNGQGGLTNKLLGFFVFVGLIFVVSAAFRTSAAVTGVSTQTTGGNTTGLPFCNSASDCIGYCSQWPDSCQGPAWGDFHSFYSYKTDAFYSSYVGQQFSGWAHAIDYNNLVCSGYTFHTVPECVGDLSDGQKHCGCSFDVEECAGGCLYNNQYKPPLPYCGTAACTQDADCATPKTVCTTDGAGYEIYHSTCKDCSCQTVKTVTACQAGYHCEPDLQAEYDGKLPSITATTTLGVDCYKGDCVPVDGAWSTYAKQFFSSSTSSCDPKTCTQKLTVVNTKVCYPPNECGKPCPTLTYAEQYQTTVTTQSCATGGKGAWQLKTTKKYDLFNTCGKTAPCKQDTRVVTTYQCNKVCGVSNCGSCAGACLGRVVNGNCLGDCQHTDIVSTRDCDPKKVTCSPATLPHGATWWGPTSYQLTCTIVRGDYSDPSKLTAKWITDYNPSVYRQNQTTDPCRWHCDTLHYHPVETDNKGNAQNSTQGEITCEPNTQTSACPALGACASYGAANGAQAAYYTQTWDDSQLPAAWSPRTTPNPVYAGKATAKDQCVYDCITSAHYTGSDCQGDQTTKDCDGLQAVKTATLPAPLGNGELMYQLNGPTAYGQHYDCADQTWKNNSNGETAMTYNTTSGQCHYSCNLCNGYVPQRGANPQDFVCRLQTCADGKCQLPADADKLNIVESGAKTYARVLAKGAKCYDCSPLALTDQDVYDPVYNINNCHFACKSGYELIDKRNPNKGCKKIEVDCIDSTGVYHAHASTKDCAYVFSGLTTTPPPPQDWAYGDGVQACTWHCADHYQAQGTTCVADKKTKQCDNQDIVTKTIDNQTGRLIYTDDGDQLSYDQQYDCNLNGKTGGWNPDKLSMEYDKNLGLCNFQCNTCNGYEDSGSPYTPYCRPIACQGTCQLPTGIFGIALVGAHTYQQDLTKSGNCYVCDPSTTHDVAINKHSGLTQKHGCYYDCDAANGYKWVDADNECEKACGGTQPEHTSDRTVCAYVFSQNNYFVPPANATWKFGDVNQSCYWNCTNGYQPVDTNGDGIKDACQKTQDGVCGPLPDGAKWNAVGGWKQYWSCAASDFRPATETPSHSLTANTYDPSNPQDKSGSDQCDPAVGNNACHCYWICDKDKGYEDVTDSNGEVIGCKKKNQAYNCQPENVNWSDPHLKHGAETYTENNPYSAPPPEQLWGGHIKNPAISQDQLKACEWECSPSCAYTPVMNAANNPQCLKNCVACGTTNSGDPFVAPADVNDSRVQVGTDTNCLNSGKGAYWPGENCSTQNWKALDINQVPANACEWSCRLGFKRQGNECVSQTAPTACTWRPVGLPRFSAATTSYESLAINPSTGQPYVAFSDGSVGGAVTVMKYDGKAWVVVGPAGFSDQAYPTSYESLAFDSYGKPYVAFSDGKYSGKTTVMEYSNGAWSAVGGIRGFGGKAQYQSLIITPGNNIIVAYEDLDNSSETKVKMYFSDTWQDFGVGDISSDKAEYQSLAFVNGQPAVAFKDYAHCNGGATVMTAQQGHNWSAIGSYCLSGRMAQFESLSSHAGQPYLAWVADDGVDFVMNYDYSKSSWQLVNEFSINYDASAKGPQSLVFSTDIKDDNPYVAYQSLPYYQYQANLVTLNPKVANVGQPNLSDAAAAYVSLAFGPTDHQPYVAYQDHYSNYFTGPDRVTVMTCAATPDACGGQTHVSYPSYKCPYNNDVCDYDTVQPGDGRCWMKENVDVGSMVTAGKDVPQANWQKFCYNNNNNGNECQKYGGYYYWHTTLDIDSKYDDEVYSQTPPTAQGICPDGWHVPNVDEYTKLISSLLPYEGDKLKNVGLCQGRANCNDSNFSQLLTGWFDKETGSFNDFGISGWQQSTYQSGKNLNSVFGADLVDSVAVTTLDNNKGDNADTLRCIKDLPPTPGVKKGGNGLQSGLDKLPACLFGFSRTDIVKMPKTCTKNSDCNYTPGPTCDGQCKYSLNHQKGVCKNNKCSYPVKYPPILCPHGCTYDGKCAPDVLGVKVKAAVKKK